MSETFSVISILLQSRLMRFVMTGQQAEVKDTMLWTKEEAEEETETISRKKSVNRRPRIGMNMLMMYAEM